MKMKFSKEGNDQWDEIGEPETSGPMALSPSLCSGGFREWSALALDKVSGRCPQKRAGTDRGNATRKK